MTLGLATPSVVEPAGDMAHLVTGIIGAQSSQSRARFPLNGQKGQTYPDYARWRRDSVEPTPSRHEAMTAVGIGNLPGIINGSSMPADLASSYAGRPERTRQFIPSSSVKATSGHGEAAYRHKSNRSSTMDSVAGASQTASVTRDTIPVAAHLAPPDPGSLKVVRNSVVSFRNTSERAANSRGLTFANNTTNGTVWGANMPEARVANSPITDDGSGSNAQSSSVGGELWLDTVCLRDWLQAYLSDETARAARAPSR
jgi:hypothetical protein